MGITNLYSGIVATIPENQKIFVSLFIYTVLIVIYAVFVWKFYKFMAKRNILGLNLGQYDFTENEGSKKFLATLFYILEYIIIVPLMVFFWFGILSVFFLVLSKSQSVEQILLIAAAVIAATRVAAYISADLAKDLGKMVPFTILAVFLLDPNFFNFNELIARAIEVPSLLSSILIYIIFIVGLEIIMRLVYLVFQVFQNVEEVEAVKESVGVVQG